MDKLLKILVADDEPKICRMISDLIDTDRCGAAVCATAFDGETLLALIKSERPDIVISDIYMPKLDGLEVLKEVKQSGIDCHYIMVTGYKQFDYAYTALKYSVDDFLLKPIDENALNGAVRKAAEEIRKKLLAPDSGTTDLAKSFLLEGDLGRFRFEDSAETLNSKYGTAFKFDTFRFISIKQDYEVELAESRGQLTATQKKLNDIICRRLAGICGDIVTYGRGSSLIILADYPSTRNAEFLDIMNNSMAEINSVAEVFAGLRITVAMSAPVNGPSDFASASESLKNCLFRRRMYGTGKLYIAGEQTDVPDSYKAKLSALRERIIKSYDSLDCGEFERTVDELFNLPFVILLSQPAMELFRDICCELFSKNGSLISKCASKEELWSELMWDIENAYTLEKYKLAIKGELASILKRLSVYAANQSLRTVRKGMEYIENHYADQLSVEDVAEQVNLSVGYFSSIFKKETGKTFTEYLTSVRISSAKDLLRDSNMNVNEIADAVGLPNARYFSKQFKKLVGVTPKEFRQIHG